MPKRTDLKSILIIGSGPIVIGQACEFDYSGTQAVKALKEEGYRVILVNSNPATIMTDPEFADRTYIEPIEPDFIEAIIKKERPDAILPTMGGQTALNCAIALGESGVLDTYNCELIGANIESIKTAEDRELFRSAMDEIGLSSAKSGMARSIRDAEELANEIGYPLILRPSRTLGGMGGGIVTQPSELKRKVQLALTNSPNKEVLIEKSLLGWKEVELEVMRDLKDNVVVICAIENIDPMGIHTGDSITVAPLQTITDKEYQVMREAAKRIMRRIGVDTGGSNVQFALNPENGELLVIEMNPRVSRSSALASKATGFPIAKIAAKLAIGYTLDEIPNDITRETPACFEPSIDYTVVKIPRFNFEKFPLAETTLGTQMKSVGEVMSFGRSFAEAMQKALCSMERDSYGFDFDQRTKHLGKSELLEVAMTGGPDRIWYVAEALRAGCTPSEVAKTTGIDLWFLSEIAEIVSLEEQIRDVSIDALDAEDFITLKRVGFSDGRIAKLVNTNEDSVHQRRKQLQVVTGFKSVDTCAAEFLAHTPYLYSTYETHSDAPPSDRKKIIILGSGPNRIGQGIEFDYCCVHAVQALRADGYEAIMINCNPETVSTDYDISDRLYFEPLSFESVMQIVDRENPYGVIVQFGGQTPLKLAARLEAAGVPIIGTSVNSIDLAEDRERFGALIQELGLKQPAYTTVRSYDEALRKAEDIGFPLMIRPSFVLGGRAMKIVHNREEILSYMEEGVEVSNDRPVLLDRYLHNAIELDVDVVADGEQELIAGIMEHIERAGIHSGDSSCTLPPQTISLEIQEQLKVQARAIARKLSVIGLMNVQFAVTANSEIYILEVNPRASRTVPFVSKATGVPWAKIAARVMAGKKLSEIGAVEKTLQNACAVKACVFPFNRFPGVDTILGPEMKSTGEVMGIHRTFAGGFAKAQYGAGVKVPSGGTAFLSVMDTDKAELPELAEKLVAQGFTLVATHGTADFLIKHGFTVEKTNKVLEGSPHIVDMLGEGKIDMVINTPEGSRPLLDSRSIRLVANELGVPTFTTIAAARAAVEAASIIGDGSFIEVAAIQDYY